MGKHEGFTTNRRRFLQASAATGAAAAALSPTSLSPLAAGPAEAQAATPETKIVKNICHQCPARCGIDVYVTNGRVHAIYGTTDHPISNGKLCPKGPLGTHILYDPDRFKGPMRRTNPAKGRDEDPGFVPISWDEALDEVAARLNDLRARGESHRFALLYGRGWGASCAGLQGTFGQLYGSPNVAIGHSSMCSDGSIKAKQFTDGNGSYNSHDYRKNNYLLMFGAGFLEAFRPYNNNMQIWGHIRGRKAPKTRVTAVDVHVNTTLAASDRGLLIKPGTDGALALAIAHVILTEGLWERSFVGDFDDGVNRFVAGQEVPLAATPDPAEPVNAAPDGAEPETPLLQAPPEGDVTPGDALVYDPDDPDGPPSEVRTGQFVERWVHGLVEWWNIELKDRTPAWAAEVTTIPEATIIAVAREFGSTRPSMAIFERGAHAHSNGVFNGMAIHTLNALVGSLFAEGGLGYQMGPSYGPMPVDAADYMDDYAQNGPWRDQPRIDLKGHADGYLLANNMMQDIGPNHLAGNPYKLDTMMLYATNPIWTAPNGQVWEEAMKDVFIIDTSPFPSESAMYADLILPDHTYLERMQDSPTYPFEGWPLTQLRTPSVDPVYDTKHFGDILIELGKRINGPMGEFYRAINNVENVLRHRAAGFANNPGDNGVNDFESWKREGVWYKKPYHWRYWRGNFYEWDGQGYNNLMSAEDVKSKLLKTSSGKFEFVSSHLEGQAAYINRELGIPTSRVGIIQWLPAQHTGGGDLHFVTPKTPMTAEGRSGNIPHAIAIQQPSVGGKTTVYMEINPQTARSRNIRNGDKVRISSPLGSIEAYARLFEGARPDTVVMPFEHGHWAQGRWAKDRKPGNSGEVTANVSDPISGLACYYTGKVTVERA